MYGWSRAQLNNSALLNLLIADSDTSTVKRFMAKSLDTVEQSCRLLENSGDKRLCLRGIRVQISEEIAETPAMYAVVKNPAMHPTIHCERAKDRSDCTHDMKNLLGSYRGFTCDN